MGIEALKEDFILEPLTVEEMALQDRSVEDKVHFYKGIWWKQLRPFFYQPVNPLSEINARESWPHPIKSFGGYCHLVRHRSFSNAKSFFMVNLNIKDYSLDNLRKKRRESIKSAQKKVDVRIVVNISDLLTDGYETFKSFYLRTQWGKSKKLKFVIFKRWIEKTFDLPKRIILGAYLNNKLIGFSLSHAIRDIGRPGFIASHSDFLRYRPNELLLHNFLLICKRSPKITRVLHGMRSSKKSLDDFKKDLGFEEVEYPTYVKLNPIARTVTKTFMKKQYRRLLGYFDI